MKKTALMLALAFALSGCAGKQNIDELISAQELPEYKEAVDIQVSDHGTQPDDGDVIVIDE